MDDTDADNSELARWDPSFVERVKRVVGPIVKKYFRSEVKGLDRVPPAGGALVVSNHSGGMFTPDVLVFATAFYDRFGYDRPLFTLGHDTIYIGPFGDWLPRAGVIHAGRQNAADALRSGAAVLVFPGGDYDSYRPTAEASVVNFNNRTGYVRTAIETGVPIVPVVSIGAQESQLFLSRGTGLAKRLGFNRLRLQSLPITVGVPFGLSVFLPINLPLPTKIITQVLDPIDITSRFGDDPSVDEVDAHVRSVMQTALDRLARERRFPVLG